MKIILIKIQKQFIVFSLIGTVGLIVDLITLYFASQFCNFIFARLISFIFAVITTWILNRNLTFDAESITQPDNKIYCLYFSEFIRYFIANSFGGILNLSTYYLFLTFKKGSANIYIATVLGGIAGLIINFILSKLIVFKKIK